MLIVLWYPQPLNGIYIIIRYDLKVKSVFNHIPLGIYCLPGTNSAASAQLTSRALELIPRLYPLENKKLYVSALSMLSNLEGSPARRFCIIALRHGIASRRFFFVSGTPESKCFAALMHRGRLDVTRN